MENKFNPEDLRNPLYEYSQVITVNDLYDIYSGLAVQYDSAKWWEFKKKKDVVVAAYTIKELLTWIQQGKPTLADARSKQYE